MPTDEEKTFPHIWIQGCMHVCLTRKASTWEGGGEIGEGGSVNGPKVFFIGSKKGQDGKPQR